MFKVKIILHTNKVPATFFSVLNGSNRNILHRNGFYNDKKNPAPVLFQNRRRKNDRQRIRSAARTNTSSCTMARAANQTNKRATNGKAMAGRRPCTRNVNSEKTRQLRK